MLLHEMLKEIKDSAYIKKITQDSVTKKEGDFKDSSDVLTQDPLAEKGEKILAAMKKAYGEEKGEQIFYASKNKGTISGVDVSKDANSFSAAVEMSKEYGKGTTVVDLTKATDSKTKDGSLDEMIRNMAREKADVPHNDDGTIRTPQQAQLAYEQWYKIIKSRYKNDSRYSAEYGDSKTKDKVMDCPNCKNPLTYAGEENGKTKYKCGLCGKKFVSKDYKAKDERIDRKFIASCPACQEMKKYGLSYEETHSSHTPGKLLVEVDGREREIPNPHIVRDSKTKDDRSDERKYCSRCKKLVEVEGGLDRQGIYNKCMECGATIDSKTKDQSTRLASLKRQLEQAKRTGGDQEYVKELEEEIVQLEKEDQGRQTQDESKPIVEIYPTGDPFGRGFEASQSVDGGKSWVYRGDLGRQSREFWRTYCQTKGYILRTRDAASKSLKVKTKDAVLCGGYKGFQIHQVSDSKFTAFTNFGSSQPGVELIGNSIDDIKNKIDQYDKKSQSGNDYSEKEMNTRDSKTKDESPAIGKHSDVPDDQFNQEELQKGIEIEKEHTDDPELAKQIAKDHLSEVRDYYTRLIAMEAEAKENKTENDLEDNQ